MTFDPTKPVQTRDGRPVRIIATDRKSSAGASIVALVPHPVADEEDVVRFKADGTFFSGGRNSDLVNVPETTERFLNIDLGKIVRMGLGDYPVHTTAFGRHLDQPATATGYSTLKLTFTDGKLTGSEVIRSA